MQCFCYISVNITFIFSLCTLNCPVRGYWNNDTLLFVGCFLLTYCGRYGYQPSYIFYLFWPEESSIFLISSFCNYEIISIVVFSFCPALLFLLVIGNCIYLRPVWYHHEIECLRWFCWIVLCQRGQWELQVPESFMIPCSNSPVT